MSRASITGWMGAFASALLVVASLTACTPDGGTRTDDSGTVDAKGFSLQTGTASAVGGAGVAASGTSVALSEVKHTFTSPEIPDLARLGQPVRLRFAKDAQPHATITIRLKVDPKQVSTADWSTPRTYAVLTQSAGADSSTLLPATYDAKTGYLTARTDHLSWFEPVQLILSSFVQHIGSTVLHGIGVEFDEPDCAGKQLSASLNGVTYSTSGSWAIDPCLTTVGGALRLKLFSKTGIPFQVRSTPTGTATPLPGLSATSIAQQVAFDLLFSERNAKFVGPGGELDYTYAEPSSTSLSFVEAPAMLYVTTLIDFAAATLPEASTASKALEALDKLDCMSQIVDTAQGASKLTSAIAGDLTSAFVTCAGEVFTDVVWTLATAGPSLLVNMGLGIVTELAGQGSFTIAIKALAPQPVLAALSAFGPSPNYAEGFGTVKPAAIFNGGDPTGQVTDIVWQSWGGSTAIGYGKACDASHSASVADCPIHRAEVIASNLGTCDGKRAYEDVGWFFPGYDGQTVETAMGDDIRDCNYG